jgi:bifunctional non-homologous end joining protein LigD
MAADPPGWIDPMLATLTDGPFSDPDWIFEPKLDGERGLAHRRGGSVELWSRNRKRLTDTYPEITEALAEVGGGDLVLDGEIVAFDQGRPSFGRLQQRIGLTDPDRARRSGVTVAYLVFDILRHDGRQVTDQPLVDRRRILEDTVESGPVVVRNGAWPGDGELLFNQMCAQGWEGVVAKRAASPYVSRRSRDWLKIKCVQRQELVVGGFTEPKGTRVGLGALLVGYYDDGELRYAGKVGTGFSQRVLRSLRDHLDGLAQPQSPFAEDRIPERDPHWVRPELVAEVSFSEWTSDGRLRHPTFLGLRDDKAAGEVVRERPSPPE